MVESGAFCGIARMGSSYNLAFPACALALSLRVVSTGLMPNTRPGGGVAPFVGFIDA